MQFCPFVVFFLFTVSKPKLLFFTLVLGGDFLGHIVDWWVKILRYPVMWSQIELALTVIMGHYDSNGMCMVENDQVALIVSVGRWTYVHCNFVFEVT